MMQPVNYQLERWLRQDWRKNTRHYSCELRQDLFGCWIVLRRWGRVNTLRGQSLEHSCDSYEEGAEILKAVAKRRAQRGYIEA